MYNTANLIYVLKNTRTRAYGCNNKLFIISGIKEFFIEMLFNMLMKNLGYGTSSYSC